jgi:ubiquinone/menaquinone biosynthesis C-methylase UbiE
MIDIAEYDLFDYDYSKYWEKRAYENLAEKNLLNKIFLNKGGYWFLDIGGSYGRLTSTYYDSYNKPVIIDYSLKTLIKNRDFIKTKYPNTELIAANAYKMPFRENTFDGALMVRVIHHIEKPDIYFKELNRIMKGNSSYIQEFPNKIHIKAVFRALMKLDFNLFKREPYLQPQITGEEGSNKEYNHIFYNYHPKHIKKLLKENNFKILRKYGCSYLRSPFIKKMLGENLMIFIEKIMQNTLSWTNISPSIFLDTQIKKDSKKDGQTLNLADILVCPSCKKSLTYKGSNLAICKKCSKNFHKKDDVWDFRIK